MPIKAFYCKKCKKEFEELVFNSKEKVECPICKTKYTQKQSKVNKIFSVPAIYKCAGFYVTDSRRESGLYFGKEDFSYDPTVDNKNS